jgi:hypothetical protein
VKHANGWTLLVLAAIAAIGLWYYDNRVLVRPVQSLPNRVPNASLGGLDFNQVLSGATSIGEAVAAHYDTGEDAGVTPGSRAQTEAAYNQSPDVGSGEQITAGIDSQASDYDNFVEPSDL